MPIIRFCELLMLFGHMWFIHTSCCNTFPLWIVHYGAFMKPQSGCAKALIYYTFTLKCLNSSCCCYMVLFYLCRPIYLVDLCDLYFFLYNISVKLEDLISKLYILNSCLCHLSWLSLVPPLFINLSDECALGYYICRSLFPACSLARFLLIKSGRVFLGGALASSGLSLSGDDARFDHPAAVRLVGALTHRTHN